MSYLILNKEMIILAIIGLVIVFCLLVKLFQRIGLEKIRAAVYQLFLDAEHAFHDGAGTEKFEYVINLAKTIIPAPFNLFITERLLRRVVQSWFDIIKDLLDDGKFNKGKEKMNANY